jgi:antitoxin PrlF
MVPSSRLNSKGQVTLPREVRERLGLKQGDRVEFVFEEGRTTIRPVRAHENPFAKYAGALPAFSGIREVNAWVREMRDEEDPKK